MELSIVIPAYNEAAILHELYQRLTNEIKPLSVDYEILLVNDGSTDDTLSILRALRQLDSRVNYLSLSRNFGHQPALFAGLSAARGEVVVMMDADLQDDPTAVPILYRKLLDGYDVVYATRAKRHETVFRRLSMWLFYRIFRLTASLPFPLDAGIFSAMRRHVVDAVLAIKEDNKFIAGLRYWVGFSQIGIPFERPGRYDNQSRVGFWRLARLALNAIFGFSYRPLRIMMGIGLITFALSLAGVCWVLAKKYLLSDAIPGWSSILIAIFFLGGLQLLSTGFVGEYVLRISDNVRRRPYYILNPSQSDPYPVNRQSP